MKKICIILTVALLAAGIFAPTASCEEAVTVIEKKGRVQVVFAGRKRPEVCMEGMELEEGTTIRTKKDSSVILAIDKTGKNLARVEELSEIILRIDSKGEIELIDGELFAVLKGMKEGTKFAIRTPSAVCGARGTGWLTTLKNGITTTEVFDGTIFSGGLNPDGTPKGEEFFTSAGFMRTISAAGDISDQIKISMERMKQLGVTGQDMIRLQMFMNKWSQAQQVAGTQDKMVEKFMQKGRDFDARTPFTAPSPMPAGRDDDDNRKKSIEGGGGEGARN